MKLAIIAAGDGSRLIREGIDIPKPLVKVSGIPMIERIIRIAKHTGFESVSCIINAHSEELNKFLTSTDFGLPLSLKVLTTPSSMHSLFELSEYLREESFCLTTADTIFDRNEFSKFISYAKERQKSDGLLAVTKFIDDENPLYVKMDRNNLIENFGNDGETAASAMTKNFKWVTGGIYFFSPRIFELIQTALNLKIMRLRNFLRLLLGEGYILEGYPFSKIIDVDHKDDIEKAEEYLIKTGIATSLRSSQIKV